MARGVLKSAFRLIANSHRALCCRYKSTASHLTAGSHDEWMIVHPEVFDAQASGSPVVALETTIVTHGMPYPANLSTAREVEQLVRSYGAVPATIGVLDGRVHVGMSESQLERLATPSNNTETVKISRRDMAYILSQGLSGGTTVSGTMLCSHKAGIKVFVTGGIGGVHRDGENTLDISADLTELGRTPVAVVCAGVKSILDIGRTLEVLETQGVTVATYGNSREFPAFFTAKSGHESPCNVSSPLDAARLIDANDSFNVNSGVVIAVPIPASVGCLGDDIEQAIQAALHEAKNAGIHGKAVTPYILRRVNELTRGKSLEANIALIKHNAEVGSRIAVELSKLRQARDSKCHPPFSSSNSPSTSSRRPVVVGASILDFTAKARSQQIKSEGTNPGSLTQSFGGVGRNIAESMARLGTPPTFLSAIGKDQNGRLIANDLQECGMSLSGLIRSERLPTATYCVVLEGSGEMFCAIGDMDVNNTVTTDLVKTFSSDLAAAPIVCADGNIPVETLSYVCDLCWDANVPVWYEPACVDKAVKPVIAGVHSKLSFVSPNLAELRSMCHALTGRPTEETPSTSLTLEEKLSECRELVPTLLQDIQTVIVSLGKDGLVYFNRHESLHYPAAATHLLPVRVVSVSGAGDSFVGGMISGLTQGLSHDLAIKAGLHAAYYSLHSTYAVSRDLSPSLLHQDSIRAWADWEATPL